MNSGEPLRRNRSRDEAATGAVLEHVARYRLTVFDAVRRLPALADSSDRQINRLLRSCQRRQLIDCASLCEGTRYWYLQPAGAQRLGLSEQRSGPLAEPAMLRAYAMLRFCCLRQPALHRLTSAEMEHGFPTLHRPGLPGGYYFDPQGAGKLGLLRVDTAGRGRWDRVIQSLRQDIQVHALHAGFRQLIAGGRFEITQVTLLPQKQARLQSALEGYRDARRVPVRIIVLPELLPLVGMARKEVHTR